MSTVASAGKLVRRGLRVFRLDPGEKRTSVRLPAREYASEATEVFDMFSGTAANVGIAMHGLLGLDFDKGAGGLESLDTLKDRLPETLVQSTAHGGFHYIYRLPPGIEVPNSAGKIAPGVDVRGGNGHLVGAGSTVDGLAYAIAHDAPIALAPDWLITLAGEARPRAPNAGQAVCLLDTPEAIASARAYLEAAPPAIEGQGGDPATIVTANHVMDLGISPELAAELMAEHWNDRCVPPWELSDLEYKVGSAFKSRQEPLGSKNPAAGFEAAGEPEAPLFLPASRWIGATPEPAPFIIGTYVPRDYVTIIGAAGGRGKSSLVLQAMASIAAGADFLGCPVMPGAAAGIFCEDTDAELHRRLSAICQRTGIDFESIAPKLFPTSFLSAPSMLWKEGAGRTELFARINRAAEAIPDLRLLSIDGAADTFAGNENDRTEVSNFMRELNALATCRGIAVQLVMHESKTTADDDVFAFSGSTAWFNKCRSAIKVAPVDGHDNKRRLLHLKCNVGRKAQPMLTAFEGFAYARLADDESRAANCAEITKSLMLAALAAGEKLSPNKRASNYAARWLEDHQSGTDFTHDEFALQLGEPLKLGLAIATYSSSGGGRTAQRYVLSGAVSVPCR